MGRLLAIDYGRKRCGVAVTDTLQIVATALATVPAGDLVKFLSDYTSREPVDEIIVGLPRTMRGEQSESMKYILPAVGRIRSALPDIPVIYSDERFTSVLAHRAMIDSGVKKMDRRDKGAVDRMSAVIILNDYLQSRQYNS
ncbi:MAG: Holliday junction resolvase RuvX [Duncaniella sp.]|nr:Holliday junction resolvase RuvX [Duncaniella sp.]